MPPPYRAEIRFACRYREVVQRLHKAEEASFATALNHFRSLILAVQETHGLWDRTRHRGWSATRTEQRDALKHRVRSLIKTAEEVSTTLALPSARVPELREMFEELQQLEKDFGSIALDLRAGTLDVVTDSITLQNVVLGRFKIRFEPGLVNERYGNDGFRIIAVRPNPAAEEESVTHPHVRDEELCAGNSGTTIHQAVLQGRLADAFLMIRAVLTNYNALSPHVPLTDWGGVRCSDCGISIDPDDENGCTGCRGDYCGDCVYSCAACEDYRCDACMSRCGECEDRHCRGCLETLETTEGLYCSACIQGCEACHSRYPRSTFEAGESLCSVCAEAEARRTEASPVVPIPSPPSEAVHGMVTFVARI